MATAWQRSPGPACQLPCATTSATHGEGRLTDAIVCRDLHCRCHEVRDSPYLSKIIFWFSYSSYCNPKCAVCFIFTTVNHLEHVIAPICLSSKVPAEESEEGESKKKSVVNFSFLQQPSWACAKSLDFILSTHCSQLNLEKDLSPLPVRAWRVVALFLWKGKAKSVEGQHGGFSLKLRSKQKLFLCSNRLLPTLFIFGPAELCQSSWGRLQAADKERSLGDIELNLVALFLHSPWFFVSPRGDTCSQQKGRRKKRGSWWRKWCLGLRCVQGGHCNPDLGGSVWASLESVQLLCGQVSSQNAADLKIELRRGEELKEK